MRILLVEDDEELAHITALNLKRLGLVVDVAFSGEEALDFLEENKGYDVKGYDVVVLDLVLPDIEGTKLLKEIKSEFANIPALALTAKNAEEDRIRGIKIGFDDYLTKPFSYHELAARLRVLYRSQPNFNDEVIKIGSLQIKPASHTVFIKGNPIKLSLNEFRLLFLLAQQKGQMVSKKEILESVWDRNGLNTNGKLMTTISRLRAKIGDRQKKIIETVRNGYFIR